jgi:hypothetical protein
LPFQEVVVNGLPVSETRCIAGTIRGRGSAVPAARGAGTEAPLLVGWLECRIAANTETAANRVATAAAAIVSTRRRSINFKAL